MTAIAARRPASSPHWLFGLASVVALFAGFVVFMLMVVKPWADARDARDALHAKQTLAAIHKFGFVHVTSKDFYTSSYYNGPSAFQYPVGTCRIEIVLDGSGTNTRPYIVLKNVEGSILYVTYRQLTHIPQTKACFSR